MTWLTACATHYPMKNAHTCINNYLIIDVVHVIMRRGVTGQEPQAVHGVIEGAC